jgi:hypothetical protein
MAQCGCFVDDRKEAFAVVDGIMVLANGSAAGGWNIVLILPWELVGIEMTVECYATSGVGNLRDGRGRLIIMSLHRLS